MTDVRSLEAFARLFREKEGNVDLLRAGLMVASDACPDLDVDRYVVELARLGEQLRTSLPATISAEQKVIRLNRFMFGELGFRGNADAYYDPKNSYLNEVIDRRKGIPITLSIIYMCLGRKIGLPLEGLAFPGHFLVRLRLPRGTLVLDPFAKGEPQSAERLRERIHDLMPQASREQVPMSELPLEQFLEPAPPRQIVARLLRNLKAIHRKADDSQRLLDVLNRLLVLLPDSAADLRERGLLYETLECWRPALADLSRYLECEPQSTDQDDVRIRIVDLQVRCARLN